MLKKLFGLFASKTTMEVARKEPVVFVIGCTGTGKSDLGVAAAKKYNGEVISADSMQIYKGLDIATNKMTTKEMEGIPHHLMSFVDPATEKFHVQNFREMGLKKIQEIRDRGKVPVVVGGTTYYVESLLFDNNFIQTENSKEVDNSDLDALSNTQLYDLLKEVDPVSASLNHPNNRARVRRAVEIFRLTGKRKSEHILNQHGTNGGTSLGGRLRFRESLIIALDASLEVLDERLDGRVDKMKKLGLQKELTEFYEQHKQSLEIISHGVLQCIGLKEFVPYLELSEDDRKSSKGEKLFAQGYEDVKLHTRQYSRKQRNWVNSRLVRRQIHREVPSMKKLDTSDKHTFLETGMRIVDEWMQGKDVSEEAIGEVENSLDANATTRCEVCDIMVSGKKNWENHLAGRKHRARCRSETRQKQMAGIEVVADVSETEKLAPIKREGETLKTVDKEDGKRQRLE